jgi:hypothetical protein
MSATSTISPPGPPSEPEGGTRVAIRDVPWTYEASVPAPFCQLH